MFASLEGMARDNAKMIDKNWDLHVMHILDGLDSLYGVSMTFQSLNATLCGLQQKPMEPTYTYYNHMAEIMVILREHHGNCYRPGELARMSKDCFYAGLLAENCPIVVHLKYQPHTTPLDLMKALLEQEENDALTRTHYPPSTSARPSHPPKLVERYHRQSPAEKRNDRYTVCPTQLDAGQVDAVPKTNPSALGNTMDALESWYNDGFLIGLWQATKISEYWSGRCFNCQKEGHHWHQCKELLSPELQELSDKQDKEWDEWKKKALNPQGVWEASEGRPHPYTTSGSQPSSTPGTWGPRPVDNASTGGSPYKYWNEDTLSRWLGPENLGWAILDGVRTRVLVDNGARVNSVMPAYVRQHRLGVHPISELDHSLNPFWDCIPLVGLGGGRVEPTGFTLMRVQIEGMPHYDEQQVIFILDDPSGFSARIPVILGTPTINRGLQTMKELEMHDAPVEWQAA